MDFQNLDFIWCTLFRNKKQVGSRIFGVRLFLFRLFVFSRFPENINPSILNGFWRLLIFAVFPDFRYTDMASDDFESDFFIISETQ